MQEHEGQVPRAGLEQLDHEERRRIVAGACWGIVEKAEGDERGAKAVKKINKGVSDNIFEDVHLEQARSIIRKKVYRITMISLL